jgi:hypothetical protein
MVIPHEPQSIRCHREPLHKSGLVPHALPLAEQELWPKYIQDAENTPPFHRIYPEAAYSLLKRPLMLGTILIVVLILMLIGAVPAWPHSRNWGYYPSGGLGLVVIIVVILLLLGRI